MPKIGYYQHYKTKDFYKVTGTRIHKDKNSKLDGKVVVEYEDSDGIGKYTRFIEEFEEVIMIDGKTPIDRFKFVGEKIEL